MSNTERSKVNYTDTRNYSLSEYASLTTVTRALIVIVAGVLVGLSTVVVIYLLVYVYYVLTPGNFESSAGAMAVASGSLPKAYFSLASCVAAFVVAYKSSRFAVSYGLMVGLVAAATQQGIGSFYPPVLPAEVALYLIVGSLAGMLGGWLGAQESERSLAGERALFKALEKMARSASPDTVAGAVADALDSEEVTVVAMWKAIPSGAESFKEPDGAWYAPNRAEFDPIRLLKPIRDNVAALRTGRLLQAQRLDENASQTWNETGIRCAYVAPLLSLGRDHSGLLFIGLSRQRLSMTVRARRRVGAAAATARIALDLHQTVERNATLNERERVASEIHDSLIQYLAAAGGQLDAAAMAKAADASEAADRYLDRSREMVQEATKEARRLIHNLGDSQSDDPSLSEDIAKLARRLEEESNIATSLKVHGDTNPLSPESEHHLSRIAGEALHNVRRHSGASRATISLVYGVESIILSVSDDGVGVEGSVRNGTPEDGNSYGMRSMYQRAKKIGGQLRVESTKGSGTRVSVELPRAR